MAGAHAPFWRCPAQLGYIIDSLVGPLNCNATPPLRSPTHFFCSSLLLRTAVVPSPNVGPPSHLLLPLPTKWNRVYALGPHSARDSKPHQCAGTNRRSHKSSNKTSRFSGLTPSRCSSARSRWASSSRASCASSGARTRRRPASRSWSTSSLWWPCA